MNSAQVNTSEVMDYLNGFIAAGWQEEDATASEKTSLLSNVDINVEYKPWLKTRISDNGSCSIYSNEIIYARTILNIPEIAKTNIMQHLAYSTHLYSL